jgi:uncharacterized protein (TIGR02594 family)
MALPHGSAIYFAVDWDFDKKSELDQISAYFTAVKAALGGAYKMGVYGSGTVSRRLKTQGLVDYVWLPGSLGWSGTKQFLQDGDWTLFQKTHDQKSDIGSIDYDANLFNKTFADFGQFGPTITIPDAPASAALSGAVAVYEVSARSGLNLRKGPSESFPTAQAYANGTIVHGLGTEGDWIKVDVEGDGVADGYMSRKFLKAVTGGLPDPAPSVLAPFDVAKAELARNIVEFPGLANNNPRIVLYHSTTSDGPAPDETPWCSSFVNYCVEQAGLVGTNSKAARSWHDQHWGHDVTGSAQAGDIVVWHRFGAGDDGGHVAFLIDQTDTALRVLGGNQSNKVCVQTYPRNGELGPFNYELLSIRRA